MPTTTRFFSFTDDELLASLKALETALLSGTRQVTFLGQTVLYASASEMRNTISTVSDELCNRDALPSGVTKSTKVKRIRIQTDNSGF